MKRYKKENPLSYTLGAALTFELLKNRKEAVKSVYLHPQFSASDAKNELLALCKKERIAICESEKAFNILSPKENCFVIGEFEKFDAPLQKEGNHIVLVNPSNAGNLGTILRSCLGFGYKDIAIIRPAVDIFDPKTVRASMGALFGVRFAYYDSFEDYAKDTGSRAYYPFMLQTDTALHTCTFKQPHALIFGNESSGLPEAFLNIGTPVIIKHSREIDSLNLPIAVSVALYEASKQ